MITMVTIVTMTYKTINVNPQTYERLVYYKHANMTFDEVLNDLMNQISEEDYYKQVLDEHRKIVEEMKSGESFTVDELDDFLDNE